MTSVAEKSPSRSSPTAPKSPRPASASTASTSVTASSRLTHQSSTGSLLGNMRSARDRDIMNLVPSAAECSYAACFCEENVWKLCDHVRTNSPDEIAKSYVVFVSNKKQVGKLSWDQVCTAFRAQFCKKDKDFSKQFKKFKKFQKNHLFRNRKMFLPF